MKVSEQTLDDIDWDNLPPTTAPQAEVRVRGFSDRDIAVELGQVVGECVGTIGSFMDLSTLDGVTIAIDYDAALSSIDQGIENLRPLESTKTTGMVGVAKTCSVMRDGQVRSHLVFKASMLYPLIAKDRATDEDRQVALGLIAHECAHVQLNAKMEELISEARLGATIADFERGVLFQIAHICWDEYAACRLSAMFARRQNDHHADTVQAVVPDARARANECIKAYRLHGDVDKLLREAGSELCHPLKAISYLLGGLDADGKAWADYPDARSAIEAGGYAQLTDALHMRCQGLWDSLPEWSAEQDIMAPLIDLVRDTFSSGGIFFRRNMFGLWALEIPFSPETMPDEARPS